MSEVLRQLQ